MSEPDKLVGEVIGFRQWAVGASLRLHSVGVDATWDKGENTAVCVAPWIFADHGPVVPSHQCHCGLYALHDPGHVNPFYTGLTGQLHYVAGAVSAWGTIEAHEHGFRAQHAAVVAIMQMPRGRGANVAEAVAKAYDVPCVHPQGLERVAAEFGSPVPMELRATPQPNYEQPLPPSNSLAQVHTVLKSVYTGPPPPQYAQTWMGVTGSNTAPPPGKVRSYLTRKAR